VRNVSGRAGEDSLVAAARAGSREAFGELVERFAGPLLGFLALRARCVEDAEELVQETFLRAWRNLDRYDPRWRFSTWLFTVGRRITVSRYRRAEAESGPAPEVVAGDDPLDAASAAELRDNLWALAERLLSPVARQALWLRYVDGLGVREIARVLGRREATVRVMLFRARERLAPHLEPHVRPMEVRP